MAIEPTADELKRFVEGDAGKPFVLVQLLRFVEGGREKYLQYSAAAQPILLRIGAKVLYGGEAGPPLTGQPWDAVLVVRYPSRSAYAEMFADPDYQRIAPLRTAALREALLLPTDDWSAR